MEAMRAYQAFADGRRHPALMQADNSPTETTPAAEAALRASLDLDLLALAERLAASLGLPRVAGKGGSTRQRFTRRQH